ncbi:recombinase family protein, partial [Dehalobacter sp. UNSWDHB]|uniref:recombinase family protein n=1 Tax=Dehalobacter sp. UNSWDHB TaxID=1339256 RepID=UPI00068E1FA1
MNAVIYARFSSHAQNEQSIDGQLRVCYEYAAREGYAVVGEYIDRALTGRSDDRPDFQRMISDAKKHAFDYVIVYKLDRFARNRYDSAIYKNALKRAGVKVLSAMENIGDNPESIILEAVLEASAEYYSVDLSQKIKRGRRDSAMKGKFIGGAIPTGYKTIGGALIIDEDKAGIIKYAFEQYAAGVPKKEIMAELNARGLRNSKGKPYGITAFQKALQCEKYIGVLDQSGIRIEGGCPALIDKTTFDKVQARLALNRHKGGKNKAKVEYLLSGKLFCGHCGSTMQGVAGTGKGSGRWYYYSCRKRRAHECTKKHEKKDFIEWYVVEQTVEYVLTPPRIKQIAAAVVKQYDSEFNDGKVKEIQRRIEKLERDIKKIVDMLMDVPASGRQPLYEKLEMYGAEKADLEIDVAKLQIANKIRYTEEDIVAWLKQFCRGDLFDMEFRKRIIDVFINSIYLYDDKIIIYYNVRGGKQVSYLEMLESTADAEVGDDPEGNSGVR